MRAQVYAVSTSGTLPAASRSTNAADRETKDSTGRPQPTTVTKRLPRRLPASPFSAKPRSGRTTIRVRYWVNVYPLRVRVGVRVQRVLLANEQEHDGNGDGDLGGRDDEDQEDEDRPRGGAGLLRERHEAEVHAVQHELHAHQHDQHVAPDDDAQEAQREQRDRQRQEQMELIHGPSCRP